MDSVKRSAVTPNKSRLARTFAKVMHIRAVTGLISSGEKAHKTKAHGKVKYEQKKDNPLEDEDEKRHQKEATEAFLSKLFATISSTKAAYAQLQFAQSPYDPEGIQSADQTVVLELKNISELKQCYLKRQFDGSPETIHVLAEIQEQKSLLKVYEIMGKKLDSELKLKDSEVTFLRERLEEANKENKSIEKRLNSSGHLSIFENLHLSSLTPAHFISALRQTTKSVRTFVRLMVSEMDSAGWDLDSASNAIEPDVTYWAPSHKCFAFESFVCKEIFNGFNHPNFFLRKETSSDHQQRQRLFFDKFVQLKSVKPKEYFSMKPKSTFGKFCRTKYLRIVHPKMEFSLFGNLSQRNLVTAGEYPDTNFFAVFADMTKRVWLLHCLAFSFEPVASIFQVSKRTRFSEVYMESVCEEAFISSDIEPCVAFTVVPGFKIGKTVIQSQVYLR